MVRWSAPDLQYTVQNVLLFLFLEVGAATDVYILLSEPPVIVGDGEYCEGKVQNGNNSTLFVVSYASACATTYNEYDVDTQLIGDGEKTRSLLVIPYRFTFSWYC
jgi:hypothetical protein